MNGANVYRMYLLRLWQEDDQSMDEPAPLRIVLEEPRSGERESFPSLPALLAYLEGAMARERNAMALGAREVLMSVQTTRAIMTRYFDSEHSDVSAMAPDVVFTDMATGQESHGPEGVLQMLNYVYHVAFEATAEASNLIFGDGQAVWEGEFVGKHIGEFAGIPATNRDVRVPLCVVYDLEDGHIKRGRIYLAIPVLMQQLGVG